MRQFVQNAMAMKRIEIAVVTFGSATASPPRLLRFRARDGIEGAEVHRAA